MKYSRYINFTSFLSYNSFEDQTLYFGSTKFSFNPSWTIKSSFRSSNYYNVLRFFYMCRRVVNSRPRIFHSGGKYVIFITVRGSRFYKLVNFILRLRKNKRLASLVKFSDLDTPSPSVYFSEASSLFNVSSPYFDYHDSKLDLRLHFSSLTPKFRVLEDCCSIYYFSALFFYDEIETLPLSF